jgi:hypothetical protein
MSPEFYRGLIAAVIVCTLFYVLIGVWYWLMQ